LGFLMSLDGENHAGQAILAGGFCGVSSAYIFGNLAGNRSIANAGADEKRAALARQPPPDKALLFLYREGFVAKLAGLNLMIDERTVAQLKSPRFTCVVVAPGPHVISARFGALAGMQSQSGERPIIAIAGGVMAVGMKVRLGVIVNGIVLTPQDDVAGALARMAGMPMTPPDLAEV
jgi:hypothetical protein